MAIVLFNKKIKDDIYMLKLKGKFEGKEGQFYMLKPVIGEAGLLISYAYCI